MTYDLKEAYVIFYTHNLVDERIMEHSILNLHNCGIDPSHIILVSWKPIHSKLCCLRNIIYQPSPTAYEGWKLTQYNIFNQIQLGLSHIPGDPIVFLAEHDVLYPPDHHHECLKSFRPDCINYNLNTVCISASGFWVMNTITGLPSLLSQAHAYKSSFVASIRYRLGILDNYDGKFEFGANEGDIIMAHNFKNPRPCLDIKHQTNASATGKIDKAVHNYQTYPFDVFWGDSKLWIDRLGLTEHWPV